MQRVFHQSTLNSSYKHSVDNSFCREPNNTSRNHLINSVKQIRGPSLHTSQGTWQDQFITVYSTEQETEMLGVMGWRQCTSMPVRRVRNYYLQTSTNNNYGISSRGFPKTYRIQAEPINLSLYKYKNVILPLALHILSEGILGYQALSYKSSNLKYPQKMNISINPQNCGITNNGQFRVGILLWQNSMSKKQTSNNKCQDIIYGMHRMVCELVDENQKRQLNILKNNFEKVPQVTYNLAQVLIRQFAKSKDIMIPKNFKQQISIMQGMNHPMFQKTSRQFNSHMQNSVNSYQQPSYRNTFKSHENTLTNTSPYSQINVRPTPVSAHKINSWNVQNTQSQIEVRPNIQAQQFGITSSFKNLADQSRISASSSRYIPTSMSKIPQIIPRKLQKNEQYISKDQQKVNQIFHSLHSPNKKTPSMNRTHSIMFKSQQKRNNEFSINQVNKSSSKDQKKLTIFPQYSFVSQFSQNNSQEFSSQGLKSGKTTQCFDSLIGSPRNKQYPISSCVRNNLNNNSSKSYWQNKSSELKESFTVETLPIPNLKSIKDMGFGKNTQSLMFDRPASSDRQSIVEHNYNFGGVLPSVTNNSKESNLNNQNFSRPYSQNNAVYVQHSNFKQKITSSVYLGDDAQKFSASKLKDNGWKNHAALLTSEKDNEDLKESVYCGQQHFIEVDNLTKLSKLGKLGRLIGKSMIPIQENCQAEEERRY